MERQRQSTSQGRSWLPLALPRDLASVYTGPPSGLRWARAGACSPRLSTTRSRQRLAHSDERRARRRRLSPGTRGRWGGGERREGGGTGGNMCIVGGQIE